MWCVWQWRIASYCIAQLARVKEICSHCLMEWIFRSMSGKSWQGVEVWDLILRAKKWPPIHETLAKILWKYGKEAKERERERKREIIQPSLRPLYAKSLYAKYFRVKLSLNYISREKNLLTTWSFKTWNQLQLCVVNKNCDGWSLQMVAVYMSQ